MSVDAYAHTLKNMNWIWVAVCLVYVVWGLRLVLLFKIDMAKKIKLMWPEDWTEGHGDGTPFWLLFLWPVCSGQMLNVHTAVFLCCIKWNCEHEGLLKVTGFQIVGNIKLYPGNSLVVQWLGLSTFHYWSLSSPIPGWGTKILQAAWGSQKINYISVNQFLFLFHWHDKMMHEMVFYS